MRTRRDDYLDERGEGSWLAGMALDNPVATGGVLVMALTAGMIAANALSFQPGPHPAPLFGMPKSLIPDVVSGAPVPRAAPGDTGAPRVAPRAAPRDGSRVAAPVASELVHEVQLSLKRLGFYNGEIDGLSGPMTDHAVRAYERAAGLPERGEATHGLLAHMLLNGESVRRDAGRSGGLSGDLGASDTEQTGSVPVPPRPVPASWSPAGDEAPGRDTVRAVQQALADLGYGPVTIDGLMGAETSKAIRRFELDRGLALTGRVRPEIYAALERTAGVDIPR